MDVTLTREHPMRTTFTFLFTLSLSVPTLADAKKDSDLKKMQGTWMIAKEIVAGRELTAKEIKENMPTLTVKCGTYSVSIKGSEIDKGTMKLSSGKSPKEIDTTSSSGTKLKGIYQIKGDEMTVVFASPGQPRPKAVKYEKGSSQIWIVYRRKN